MTKSLNEFGGWLRFFYIQAWVIVIPTLMVLTIVSALMIYSCATGQGLNISFFIMFFVFSVPGILEFMSVMQMTKEEPLTPRKIIFLKVLNILLISVFYLLPFFAGIKPYIDKENILVYLFYLLIVLWLGIPAVYFRYSKRVLAYYGKNAFKE